MLAHCARTCNLSLLSLGNRNTIKGEAFVPVLRCGERGSERATKPATRTLSRARDVSANICKRYCREHRLLTVRHFTSRVCLHESGAVLYTAGIGAVKETLPPTGAGTPRLGDRILPNRTEPLLGPPLSRIRRFVESE